MNGRQWTFKFFLTMKPVLWYSGDMKVNFKYVNSKILKVPEGGVLPLFKVGLHTSPSGYFIVDGSV